MSQAQELRKIKKAYGERFMKMCRTHFPTILENEGKLYEILQSTFSDTSETLYEDIQRCRLEDKFASFIYDKFEEESKEEVVTEKTPYELLDEAGYELVECNSEKEIQSFKKYYAQGEELCTFNGDRLQDCVVFWAVKKNVKDIKRKDFKEPKRDDEYGTSVMSIQFNRHGTSRVSIKNRYNHTVGNPDATLGNDLDRIAPGLTYSFGELLKERGLTLDRSKEEFNIPGYIRARDGKCYKYNAHIGNTYYCPENIVIEDRVPQKLEGQEKQILIDYFVVDTEQKTIRMYDEKKKDSFTDALTDIRKIEVTKDKDAKDGRKNIIVYKEGQDGPIVITIDKDDRIIGYKNDELKEVGDDFLGHNIGLEKLDVPKIETVGKNFCYVTNLEELNVPSLKSAGDNFCRQSVHLRKVNAPELVEVGDRALSYVGRLEELHAPKLEKVGERFCSENSFQSIDFPRLSKVGDFFCHRSRRLERVHLPQVKIVGDYFLDNVSGITSVSMENLEKAGENFLLDATNITEFNVPKISRLQWFFSENRHMVSRINKIKKEQRIKRKDIAVLDKENELIPQEVEEAGNIIEEKNIEQVKENLIENDENIK